MPGIALLHFIEKIGGGEMLREIRYLFDDEATLTRHAQSLIFQESFECFEFTHEKSLLRLNLYKNDTNSH